MDEEPSEKELNKDPCNCSRCLQAYTLFVSFIADANRPWIHMDKPVLSYGKKNPEYAEKQRILNVFKAKVCALRNSNGGSLMVHLNGQTKGDGCLNKFDEAVERPLKSLITDGSLFTDVYKRKWIYALGKPHLDELHDVFVLTVKGSHTVCTTKYNTKVTSDLELEDPTLANLQCILQHRVTSPQTVSRYGDNLHESRHIECKEYCCDGNSDISVLCEDIWSKNICKYVTAMSNVEDGGSIFIGIKEENTGQSKTYRKIGFKLPRSSESRLESALKNQLRTTVVQLTSNSKDFTEAKSEDIKITFHRLPEDDTRVILEISVGRKEGIVFFKKGPTAYEIVKKRGKNSIKKMSQETWIDKL